MKAAEVLKFFATVFALLAAYGLVVGGSDAALDFVLRAVAILLYPVSMGLWIGGWGALGATVCEKWDDLPLSQEFLLVCGLAIGIVTHIFILGPFVVEPLQKLIVS